MMFAYGASGAAGDLPDVMSAPPARPVADELLAAVPRVPTPRPEASERLPTPDVDDVMPAGEQTCRTRLTALKVEFSELARIDGEGQCGIAFPIEVTSLGGGVELTPAGVMNCATAETAAQLVLETIGPAAERTLGSGLAGIRHASAYICRNRASEGKISEHARGNALDISAFLLEDGRTVDVVGYGPADKPERRFMQTVRSAACGPFKTVLGPGTDADHANHFHLDLAERRRGSTYCR
ncbi:MAG: extensin family protein [Rhizobiaceae bacterium]